MVDTYVRLINCRLHLFRSSASSFSSQYLLLFLKSSWSCVLLLPTPFTSVICPSMASWRKQFLLRIWPIQLTFLRRLLFRSVLSYTVKNFSDHFIFSILLQNHISKLSKYFRSNFSWINLNNFKSNIYTCKCIFLNIITVHLKHIHKFKN